MESSFKQAVGIDCAKNDFVACFGLMNLAYDVKLVNTKTFKNSTTGFKALLDWAKKLKGEAEVPLIFAMEATGVYHEKLACFLVDNQQDVSVVLPQRAKNFSKTLKTKTVTDKEASKSLAIMGLEKKLDVWQKPDELYNQLKQLTREREQVQDHLTQVKNQIHAEKAGAWPNAKSLKRLATLKSLLQRQLNDIVADIQDIIDTSPELTRKLEHVTSIPGVGLITAVIVAAETNGFNLVRNKKQLVSYAGYDVVEKQSGTSVRGKAHISHHGNKHIRRALYMPAFSGIKYNPNQKALYQRLVQKHNIKMKAGVAVQRKMLVLIYTLWKNEAFFDPDKNNGTNFKQIEQPETAALTELA